MNNTNLQIDVRVGSVSNLFWKHFGKLPFKVDALVGFLPTNGKWFTKLDMLMKHSAAGNPQGEELPFGMTSDGKWMTYFHKKVGMTAGLELNRQIGGAVYVRGNEEELDALDYAFYDVVWGIVEEPIDIRTALAKAIVLAAKQKARDITTLTLPWYGTADTVVESPEELTQHEKLLVAQAWTLGQMQGLRSAAVQLEHSVRIIILLPQEKEGLIDWVELFTVAKNAVGLDDVASVSFGTNL